MKKRLLDDLESIRKDDYYGSDKLKSELQDLLFPSNTKDLTLDLSNVTGAFYGLMLQNVGKEIGFDKIDDISKNTFYDLGKAKSSQCAMKIELPKDTRAFCIVLVSAIYDASPEYSIKIIKYSRENTVFELNGTDRYLRILNELNISQFVTFPTLIPFMDGIKDFFEIKSEIKYDMLPGNGTNEVKHIYEFNLI